MKMQFDDLLVKVTDFIRTEAKTETVVGQQFQLGEFNCVPVIKVTMGFGSGSGEGDDLKKTHNEGGVAGAGVTVDPIGFLVAKGENITFMAAGKTKGLAAAFEKVPEMIEKYMEMKKEHEYA